MTASGVRRVKAALTSGCKPHPATAPAGSDRSSHGGDEMVEAFGIACHELVSLDFRFGSGSDSIATALARLFLGVKRTKTARKRTSLPECRLLGEERTSIGASGTSLVSHKRKFDFVASTDRFLSN